MEEDNEKRKFVICEDNSRRNHYDITSVKKLSVNELTIVHYLSKVYFYKKIMTKYNGDPLYFLKEQLSWLGKIYDSKRWIDYEETEGRLCPIVCDHPR